VCRNIISDFFSLQLKLGVDESYNLQISSANESSVAGDATIEVCYVSLSTVCGFFLKMSALVATHSHGEGEGCKTWIRTQTPNQPLGCNNRDTVYLIFFICTHLP
jgi:hypothetical protein